MHKNKIFVEDATNLIIRSLFGQWPREQMAQVFTNGGYGKGEFCGRYYQMGVRERKLGAIFNILKKAATQVSANVRGDTNKDFVRFRVFKSLAGKSVKRIIDSGAWEAIFPVRLSSSLSHFIFEFQPSVIFTAGYSLSFTSTALEISNKFEIPICYFPLDDWAKALHSWSPIRKKVERVAAEITQKASIRFALGPKMAEVLSTRYNTPFESLYHADDLARFNKSVYTENQQQRACMVIGFIGSLYLGRGESLLDLVKTLESFKQPTCLMVYCPDIPMDVPTELVKSGIVKFLQLPSHKELPAKLRECDILFLPESFNPKYKKAIELSLSTKCHLYMMSGAPILVYGPSWSGTVDYAKREGWGLVIDKRSTGDLVEGIQKIGVPDFAHSLVSRALDVAKKNHDIAELQKRVRQNIERLTNA